MILNFKIFVPFSARTYERDPSFEKLRSLIKLTSLLTGLLVIDTRLDKKQKQSDFNALKKVAETKIPNCIFRTMRLINLIFHLTN